MEVDVSYYVTEGVLSMEYAMEDKNQWLTFPNH